MAPKLTVMSCLTGESRVPTASDTPSALFPR
ncbi:hypothetical protein PSO31014_01391 [Pandoraea soli]|uniref:Uncharacterized protein n=1 Tax=Pandoraea soli TaxID=2508293 RepID=A0ABY6VTR0_9BURK|nr:hypothetical protein PSO31014_01391 [Pandoraea soli]